MQNSFMNMQSEGKSLLDMHQLLLNLMELHIVIICYNKNLPLTIKTTFVDPIVFKGEIHLVCPHSTAWKMY